jgi:hypothetical protein
MSWRETGPIHGVTASIYGAAGTGLIPSVGDGSEIGKHMLAETTQV